MKQTVSKHLIPIVIIGSLVVAIIASFRYVRQANLSHNAPAPAIPAESQRKVEPQTKEEYLAYIPNEKLSVAGLKLGMSAEQVAGILGEPRPQGKSKWKSESLTDEDGQPVDAIIFKQYWDYPGLYLTLTSAPLEDRSGPSDTGHLKEIRITASGYQTSDGLGIGDLFEKVKSVHPAKPGFASLTPGSKMATAIFTNSDGRIEQIQFSLVDCVYTVYIEDADYQVAGCCLGDTDEKVLSMLGQPLSMESSEESDAWSIHYGADENSMLYYQTWSYANAKLVFVKGGLSTEPRPTDPGRLDSLIINGPDLATQDQVSMGDSVEKVKWIYRRSENVMPRKEGYIVGAVALSFIIHDGVVTSIEACISTS